MIDTKAQRKRFGMPPAVVWAGRPYSQTLRPRTFSMASMLTMTRQLNWRERPTSKLISEQAGPTGRLGE